jgi:hypothetical protein
VSPVQVRASRMTAWRTGLATGAGGGLVDAQDREERRHDQGRRSHRVGCVDRGIFSIGVLATIHYDRGSLAVRRPGQPGPRARVGYSGCACTGEARGIGRRWTLGHVVVCRPVPS